MLTHPNEFKINLPIFTGGTQRQLKDGSLTKPTKRFWLSLNNYRNWHYQSSDNCKKKFKEAIKPDIMNLPNLSALWGAVRMDYTYFPKTKALSDVGNFVSVVDKFFCDALVECGKLKDDNYIHVPGYSGEFGGVDKLNPRMEVIIRPHRKLIYPKE